MLDQAERICGVLAYGDLKRVELAMALANQPRLLLMDEPTAGMAPKERVALMALTARLARAPQLAVLFTEHDMDVVFGPGRPHHRARPGAELSPAARPPRCAPTRSPGGVPGRHVFLLRARLPIARA